MPRSTAASPTWTWGKSFCFFEEGGVFILPCWELFRTWRISGKPFPRAVLSGCSTLEMSSWDGSCSREEFSP